MKKIPLFFSFILVGSLILPINIQATENPETKEVIVVFKDRSKMNQLITSSNAEVTTTFQNIPAKTISVPVDAIENLKNNPNVLSVEENKKVKLLNANKVVIKNSAAITTQMRDWGLDKIKLNKTTPSAMTGKGVKVAIVDSGIEPNHPDLLITGGVSLVTEKLSNGSTDTTYKDYNGHGTHVAGIVAAQDNTIGTVGIAPNSKIYAVKVFDSSGVANLDVIMSGIDWAITNKMDIINLSLGSQDGTVAFEQLVNKAEQQGISVVAAAGNDYVDGNNNSVDYPGVYASTITVAATDKNNNRASFSSVGPAVEVAAPGDMVASTYKDNQYAYASGTSMAAPYVSGTLAVLKEKYPTYTNKQLRSLLTSTTIDLGNSGRDTHFGYGLIQVNTEANSTPVPNPTPSPTPTPSPSPTPTPPINTPFKDISDKHWAKDIIKNLKEQNIIGGYSDGSFKPENNVTRAEFATFISRALYLTTDNVEHKKYSDVKTSNWYYGVVQAVTREGIMTGISDTEFGANKEMTREEVVVVINRVLNRSGVSLDTTSTERQKALSQFSDKNTISSWAKDELAIAVHHGVISGLEPSKLVPKGKTNRAQTATFIYRLLERITY